MKTIVKSQLPVLALEIDEEGTVAQKSMQMTRQGQLENTLLTPCIRNPCGHCRIPGAELDDYGRAKVEQALASFSGWGGVSPHRRLGLGEERRYYAVGKELRANR